MNPLNPRLYKAIDHVFGVRRVCNQGQAMYATYFRHVDGKPRLTPALAGEYYVIVCPFCHDTNGHLYVNHRWGVRDPVNGTMNLWLANCFLGDCMRSWENRKDLFDRVSEYGLATGAGAVRVPAVIEAAPEFARCSLPSDFRLLSELPAGHAARRYVRDRGFEPKDLARDWGVGFSSALYREFPGRLVLPLRATLRVSTPASLDDPDAWEVVGFQGRVLGEAGPKTPKYLTTQHTPKSRMLYGLERVPAGSGAVVVVEGPTDVWRAGPGAVAVLGNVISDAQCRLLRSVAPGRDVAILFDPDAAEASRRSADKLRAVLARDLTAEAAPGRVAVARLPDARDPGDCTREEIMAAVRRALTGRKGNGRPSR